MCRLLPTWSFYKVNGAIESGSAFLINTADPRQVLVTFDSDATNNTVGANVFRTPWSTAPSRTSATRWDR